MALTHIVLNMDISSFANSVNKYNQALKKSADCGATLHFVQTMNITGNK